MENSLPKGWMIAKIEDCFTEIINGTTATQNDNEGIPVTRIETIQNSRFDFNRIKYVRSVDDNLLNKFQYQLGDIAFSHINSMEHVGKVAIYNGELKSLLHGMNLLRLRLGHRYILPRYAYYYFLTSAFREDVRKRVGQAVNQVSINQKNLKEIPFILCPLPEQHRIVAKLDELMEQIDHARARLERIPKILKRFRQSILAAAVSGRLTEEWRGSEYSWITWKLGEIAEVSGGVTLNSKRSTLPLKRPYLRVANVYANELRLDEIKEIGVLEQEIKRTLLQYGDLLIVEGNGSLDQIGRVAMWRKEIKDCLHQNHLIKLRFKELVTAKYVLLFLLSPDGRSQIEEVSTSTSGLNTLSISKISNLRIALPSLEEQLEIVERLERLFSFADKIEARYNKAKAQLDKLPQSLLAKAFRGELVAQNLEDEPAEVLLERIGAEKHGKPVNKLRMYKTGGEEDVAMAAEGDKQYSKVK